MRGHFGFYFFGQVGTFVYLTEAMRNAPEFNAAFWPHFSLYNLLVANFWPLYWAGFFFDRARLESIYWHVYAVAQARAGEVFEILDYFVR